MENEQETKPSGYSKRPLWQWIVIYVVIGIIVYGLVYYFVLAKKGGYNYNQTGQSQQTVYPTATQAPVETSPSISAVSPSAAMAVKEVTVTGNEFAFTPATIIVKLGEPVKLTFKNAGKYPHNLTISGLNVATKTIQPGQEDTVEFTPSKTGQFGFVCTVDSHADRGMKGTLTVQ